MRIFPAAIVLLLVSHVSAIAPNQLGNDFNDGIQQSNLKLGIGWSQENHDSLRAHLLQGQFEFFMSDRLSLRGNAGVPLSTAVSETKYYPFMLGGAFHVLPRYWIDFYFGADAGFVHIATATLPATWSTRVTPVVGATVYFWGAFFLEAEAGYNILQYAKDVAIDMSAPTYRVRTGFYL
ncbi:MAG TPA: hypothetical protein PKD60_13025 [Turneriella sp.]|nr:hypothetical protein [Turneriella sp.]HNL53985.1 hypothetical protein [Turneriella sp.]